MLDRSSAPRRIPHRTPLERVRLVVALRRLRMTAAEISELSGMALSTVSAVLKRAGLGRLSRLAPPEPANRYQRRHPGELLHVDVKKLGRIARPGHRVFGHTSQPGWQSRRFQHGWEYVHVCVDDATRLAYAEVLNDERADTAAGFLERAVAWYQAHGISVQRVMTDTAPPTAQAPTPPPDHPPLSPRTNGKAERFIQTLLRGWAYARTYANSDERTTLLPAWLNHYNWRRPHGSLSHKPPGTRLDELNNLARNYS